MDGQGPWQGPRRIEWRPVWRFSWLGVFLILMGAWLLADELGWAPEFRWSYVFAMLLILFGISLLMRRRWMLR